MTSHHLRPVRGLDRNRHPFGMGLLTAFSMALAAPAEAATALADEPLFSSSNVPGNLVLPLSVEFPTAISVAHISDTYSSASTYQGYFDPEKCYVYKFVDVESASTSMSHFAPAGAAATHACTGANDYKWSGNYLNWATMQTVDPFRWALTGGYRVVDTPSLTILEKAWSSNQGGDGNFPPRVVSVAADIQGATPFTANGNLTAYTRINGNQTYFTSSNVGFIGGILGTYFNSMDLDKTGSTPVLTRIETVDFDWGNASPQAGVVNADFFSARWVSNNTAPSTGTYNFQTVSDDGVRLWVNGNLVIDNWGDHGPTTDTSGNIVLNAGDPLNVRLEYYESGGGATIRLRWKTPGTDAFVTYKQQVAGRGDLGWAPAIRVSVCDPSVGTGGVEKNCVGYANGYYKPEGLMQKYSDRIRYSVFGYLNDSNLRRDGGVLRARQKFIGPTQPVPGSADVSNSAAEWSASTGVFTQNPDSADAAATSTAIGSTVGNSGAMNYVNKFGEIVRGSYKSYDPVGELYYAALRYLKNQGNVSEWSDMSGAPDNATKATWADGFPVVTDWKKTVNGKDTGDPILYSCQRNFILGIGDVNTHADKNVPGPTATQNEPTKPGAADNLMGDTTYSSAFNAVTATNMVGSMQGLGATFAATQNWPDCCNNNAPLMAGLAYDANTRDIRPDLPNVKGTVGQTVQTYWLDVLEGRVFKPNNQFYLAAKYGGFKAPATFDPYAASAALQTSWWNTTADTLTNANGTVTQPRPDNYYTAGRPDQMIDGLTKAFASIASELKAYTTSFSTPLPQLSTSGNVSYSAQYDASNWTGEIGASTLSFDPSTNAPSLTSIWTLSGKLAAQLAGTGWDTNRRVVTWNGSNAGVAFRATGTSALTSTQLGALDTSYATGVDSANYLNYLRGDTSNEQGTSSGAKVYRTRSKLLGDIAGSKARPVGPPSFPFSDSVNPGYSGFKSLYASRPTVVYAGANDGMLHAVLGGTSTQAGTELFAYVPSALFQGPNGTPNVDGLASLGNPSFVHHFMVNASPNVYDVDFGRTQGGSGTADWRSVLIGGLGKGGKSYYAIDVTDPVAASTSGETAVAAKVLWEFTDAALGYTYGDPVVVKTKKYGWVAILTSGYNNADGKGYFFIVNPKTGALLEKISTGAGAAANPAGLAHANAFVLDATDGTADAVYAGDLLGNLWRWDLTAASGNYSAPLNIATLTDAGNNLQPVTTRPLIEVHPKSRKRYVMFGTGRLLDDTDIASTAVQSYYMIADGTNAKFNNVADLPTGTNAVTFPITRAKLVNNPITDTTVLGTAGITTDAAKPMGWVADLGTGTGGIAWRVVNDSTTLQGTVAFAATLPNGSACSPSGSSIIYARDFLTGKSTLTSTTGALQNAAPTEGIVTDLKYLSVNGKRTLTYGTNNGDTGSPPETSNPPDGVRRLNWRELQLVD